MNRCKICFHHLDEGCTLSQYFFNQDVICGSCRRKMHSLNQIYKYHNLYIHALYLYDEFMESLMFQYKEGRDIAISDIFLKPYQKQLVDKYRHMTWQLMPSSEDKIRQRGFHHLECMLEGMDICIGKDFVKTQNYKQSRQKAKERQKIGEFIQLSAQIREPFIFFDDVCTSGNTLLSAARLIGDENRMIHCLVISIHPMFVEMCDAFQL